MRLTWAVALVTVLASAVVGCGGSDEQPADDSTPSFGGTTGTPGTSSTGTPGQTQPGSKQTTPIAIDPSVDPLVASHPEVVLLLMKGTDGWDWFCTATLVSSRVAVTAAHCLEDGKFLWWDVMAPSLSGKPRVRATSVHMLNSNYNDVANPDLGIVVLGQDIPLAQYGELTDVSAKVDANQQVQVGTIVRTAETPEATLHRVSPMNVTSTEKYGYTEGYGVPMYSHGGDSGAGMFLVENGHMTHKVVGIERQPDPQRKLDHLSRVDATYIGWVHQTGGQ